MNGIYKGYNILKNLSLTSWDLLASAVFRLYGSTSIMAGQPTPVVSRHFFTPDPWGFMIQFDEPSIFFSDGVGEKPPTNNYREDVST